jgi:TP901 family phage tail tape measure protein
MKNTSLEIKLTLGSGEVKTGLARVLADFKATSSGITQSLQSIKGFTDLKKRTAEIAKDYGEAQRKVAELARKMADGAGGAALAKDFEKAKQAAAKLKTELSAQQQQLHSVRGSMAAAGVSTSDLAGQQANLRAQLEATRKKYQDLANVAQARSTLGVTSHSDIAQEIDRAKAAYATLRTSGLATTNELAQAKVRLRERIDELREGTNGWKASLGSVKMGMLEIVAVAAPTVLAIGQAIRFESSMANVKKVVEATPKEFAALRGELLGLTRVIPMTANELAAIAVAGGQLGIAGKDLSAFVTVTAKMAIAFDMTADAAGEAIGKIKTLYGLSIPEIEALGDTINVLGNTMAAKEKDIVDVMLRIGGSVKQVGMGNDQAAALASTMLSLGMQTEVAGTAINAMINRLLTGTMQGAEFQSSLAQIGLSANEMAAQIVANPQQAIDTLLSSLGKLSGQKQAEVLTGLFGREHQDEIARLVTGVEAYRKALADLGVQANVTGSMSKEFEKRVETTAAQIQLLNNAVTEMNVNLGTVFLPTINAIIAPITKGTHLLADFAKEFPNLSAAMVGIGTGAVAVGTIVKMAGIARLAVISVKTDVVAAFAAIQGTSLGAWAASTVTAIKSVDLGAMTLKTTMGAIAGLLLAWETGKWFGGLLGEIDVVQAAMVNMIHTASQAKLEAQKIWKQMTGTDADVKAIDEKIAQDKQVYQEMLAEIKAGRGAGEKKKAPEKEAPAPAPAPAPTPLSPADSALEKNSAAAQAADAKWYTDQADNRIMSLDERALTEAELKRKAEIIKEREVAGKVGDAANSKAGLADAEKKSADERRAKIKELDANRKADPNSTYYKPTEQKVVELPRGDESIHPAAETKPPPEPPAVPEKKAAATVSSFVIIDNRPAKMNAQMERANDAVNLAEKARKSVETEISGSLAGKIVVGKREVVQATEEALAKSSQQIFEKAATPERADHSFTNPGRPSDTQSGKQQINDGLFANARNDRFARAERVSREAVAQQLHNQELTAKAADDEFEVRSKMAETLNSMADDQKKRLEEQTSAAKAATEKQVAAQKDGVGKMQSIFTAYANRVKQLQNEIAGREKSLADELNDRDPHASEETKWRRRAKAAKDYEKAAKEALAAGRLDEALALSDQAKQAYSGLKDAPKSGLKDLASRTSFAGLKSSGELGIAISKLLSGDAFKNAKIDLGKINVLDGLSSRVMADLTAKMTKLNDRQGVPDKGPVQVHEIRLGNARLQGSAPDVADFIRQLELAGMRA